MGIFDDLKNDVTNALEDDIGKTVELVRESGTFNVISGTTNTVEITYSGTGFSQSISEEYMDDDISFNSGREIVIFQDTLGPSGTTVTPEVGDTLKIDDSQFESMIIDEGPSSTLWTVVGRS